MSLAIEIGTNSTTRVLRTIDEIRALRREWDDLFRRSRATTFQSPEWLLPWMEVFSPQRMLFVEVRQGGNLIALAPLLIYRREGEDVLAFMGGGVSDYLDILTDPEWQGSIEQTLRALLNAQENWTMLDLTDLPGQSPLLKYALFRNSIREHDSCSVLRLPNSKEELLHFFSRRHRSNLRNARSRLQRAGGGQVEIATAETVRQFLNDLFTLHTGRWSEKGATGVLADEKVRNFHVRSAPELLKHGVLHLSRLRLRHCTLAVLYSFFSNQTLFCYLQGFDPHFAPLSPGTQLIYSAICDAIDRGLKNFDFLRGGEAYKQHWRPERRPTYRIQLSRRELEVQIEARDPAASRAA